MSKNDPLSLLREFTIAKREPSLVDASGATVQELTDATSVVFDDGTKQFKFARSTPTNYRRGASDEFYTLETLLFLLQRSTQSVAEYSLEGAQKMIPTVSILDKRLVLDYLQGATAHSANIVYQTESNKRVGDDVVDNNQYSGAKKPKTTTHSAPGNDSEVLSLIMSKERLAKTTASVLRGSKSFANIQKNGSEILMGKGKDDKGIKKPDPRQPGAATPASSTARPGASSSSQTPRPSANPSQARPKSASRMPIIIVPAAVTSMITMYNIKQLLEGQEFADSGDIRNKGEAKPNRLKIHRRMKPNETTKVPYEVIDNTDILRPEDWDRVVCVFTTGAEWQFKKFKWQKPVELFAQVKGFYTKWTDEQPKETIKTWNVEILSLNRHRRHADRAVVTEFWDKLQGWCLANKPFLTC
ncbi:accessory factor associated with RNA polymerase II [Mortierella hygrophila]|uniref:Accessory factor associated with RNA polymerase II n=1 Tax=Mortierella hygrophila TaxID=979708 RepID=A0A9P6F7I7_9FUNG|nr:accessory factor associated with RNA polymerase II [Mortierella hygrophila]